jgi:hypothetical protein
MRICADACFLISLYDETEQRHAKAAECFETYVVKGRHSLLFPWPVMYETISTRMVRQNRRMERIDTHLKSLRVKGQLHFVDDTPYRDRAFEACLPCNQSGTYRGISLVDRIIREMLSDKTISTHALASFNIPDFIDLCRRLNKPLLPPP